MFSLKEKLILRGGVTWENRASPCLTQTNFVAWLLRCFRLFPRENQLEGNGRGGACFASKR